MSDPSTPDPSTPDPSTPHPSTACPSPTSGRATRLGLVAALGLATVALVAGLFALPAGAQTDTESAGGRAGRSRLTEEQRQCLVDQGVERPPLGQRPSDEQIQAAKDAAEACGIELPIGRRGPVRRFLRNLTDEQRQCLQDQGLERPARGERRTDEQRQAFRDAAATCGIDLPSRPDDTATETD